MNKFDYLIVGNYCILRDEIIYIFPKTENSCVIGIKSLRNDHLIEGDSLFPYGEIQILNHSSKELIDKL